MSINIRALRTCLKLGSAPARSNQCSAVETIHKNLSAFNSSPKFQLNKRLLHLSNRRFEVVTVKCPPFAESITEGDFRPEKEIGEQVDVDDVVAEVETDKTGIPVPSPVAGVLKSFHVEEGDTVKPGMNLFDVDTAGSGGSAPEPKAPEPSVTKAEPEPAPKEAEKSIPSSLPPVAPMPTKPMSVSQSPPVDQLKLKTPVVEPMTTSTRGESRVKMNRMRQRISQRLKDAQNTAAMLTTFNEVDMTNIIAFRKKYKDAFQKKHGIKLSFMSAFIKASTFALKDQPVVNAVIDDATNEIVYRDYVDISVAVATPKGLVVPVLRDCNDMNFKQIDEEMDKLAQKARSGKLSVEDMDGGTFTISNGGVFGSMFGTPIINLPQSSILGMHATIDRPVAVNGKVEIRPMMYVALTYDHRLIDGREAVTFLKKIKQGVEDPLSLELML